MDIIEQYKLEHDIKTSEDLFNITSPPENQCPVIDSIISNIDRALRECTDGEKYDDIEDVKDVLESIEYELSGLEWDINGVRDNIIELRDWGQQWKNLAKELICKYLKDIEEV